MGNEVYANGMEIACKSANGKCIAAFPDTCLSPPSPPAGPVPIPYPNTAMASDTTDGSTTVMISGQEVMLKDQSTFKKSTGDEAATKSLGMGVVTHAIQGETSFVSWSMDVKIKGQNVDRHLDQTLQNEQSSPANIVPWIYQDMTAFGNPPECEEDTNRMQDACRSSTSTEKGKRKRQHHTDCSPECKEAMSCILVPKSDDKEMCCSPDNTGHHMIEDHWVRPGGELLSGIQHLGTNREAYQCAPCVCVNRFRSQGTHKEMHDIQGVYEESHKPGGARFDASQPNGGWTFDAGKKAALNAHDATFGDAKCSDGCIEAQLDHFYNCPPDTPLSEPGTQPLGQGRTDALANWQSSISGNH